MDIVDLIQSQIKSIQEIDNSVFLDAIKIHLDRAEYYYNCGKEDSYFFNDVIYRTNQAYEGALKEAFKILSGKDGEETAKESLYKIEKHFENNGVFKERVLMQFRNYRQEWRNESTHNSKLFFDESEAFIALVSVSAFVHLLLNQIKEKLAYNTEQNRLKNQKDLFNKIDELVKEIEKAPLSLLPSISIKLKEFAKDNELLGKENLTEHDIHGMLRAFLEASDANLKVYQEIKIGENSRLRPDFLLEKGDEKIIIEVKKMRVKHIQAGIEQLKTYLTAAKIPNGILLYFGGGGEKSNIKIISGISEEMEWNISVVEI